jgi:hypothetical protein
MNRQPSFFFPGSRFRKTFLLPYTGTFPYQEIHLRPLDGIVESGQEDN